jgi:membrane-associated HD superfamily phosphohydrolase
MQKATPELVRVGNQGLPRIVADFIRTHHGTTRVEFFYQQYLKEQTADPLTEEPSFRYPGPRPISKEATVVMLADSIEAACKSLKDPTSQDIDDMIERLITSKIEQGQLSDSTLSFSELEACKHTLKQKVRSMYHFRVEYPGQRTVK